jgi:hypothetical protein
MNARAIIAGAVSLCRFLGRFHAPAVSAWTHAMPHR